MGKQGGNGGDQELQLREQGGLGGEGNLEAATLVELHLAATGDLRGTGHARAKPPALGLPEVIRLGAEAGGPRADEAHVALQDAPELRELVEARLAKKAAQLRHPGVLLDVEVGPRDDALTPKLVLEG